MLDNKLNISRRYAQTERKIDVGFGETELQVSSNWIVQGGVSDEALIENIVARYNIYSEMLEALKMAAKHLAILYPNGLDEGLDGDAMCQEIARTIAKAEGR